MIQTKFKWLVSFTTWMTNEYYFQGLSNHFKYKKNIKEKFISNYNK